MRCERHLLRIVVSMLAAGALLGCGDDGSDVPPVTESPSAPATNETPGTVETDLTVDSIVTNSNAGGATGETSP